MRMMLRTIVAIEMLQPHSAAYCSGRICDQRGETGLRELGRKYGVVNQRVHRFDPMQISNGARCWTMGNYADVWLQGLAACAGGSMVWSVRDAARLPFRLGGRRSPHKPRVCMLDKFLAGVLPQQRSAAHCYGLESIPFADVYVRPPLLPLVWLLWAPNNSGATPCAAAPHFYKCR